MYRDARTLKNSRFLTKKCDPTLIQNEKDRVELSRALVQIFDLWQLSTAEQTSLLGLSNVSRVSLTRYRDGNPLADHRDLIERACNVIRIYTSLETLFPDNHELALAWVKAKNRAFGNLTPISVMCENGYLGLVQVRRYLEFEKGR